MRRGDRYFYFLLGAARHFGDHFAGVGIGYRHINISFGLAPFTIYAILFFSIDIVISSWNC